MEAHIVTSPNRTLAFVFFWLGSNFYLKAPNNQSYCLQSMASSLGPGRNTFWGCLGRGSCWFRLRRGWLTSRGKTPCPGSASGRAPHPWWATSGAWSQAAAAAAGAAAGSAAGASCSNDRESHLRRGTTCSSSVLERGHTYNNPTCTLCFAGTFTATQTPGKLL